MKTNTIKKNKPHYGDNIKCLLDILGIKQEVLAQEIGLSQQSISRLGNKKEINYEILERIAKGMNISVNIIKNFDKTKLIDIMTNAFQNETIPIDNSASKPDEKTVEFYERLLKEKDDKINFLLDLLVKEKNKTHILYF